MADAPNNTKAAFDENWASATEAGEYVTQSNEGAWVLAPVRIRTALLGGCPALLELDQGGQKNYAFPPLPTSDPTSNFWFPPDRLRWVNALNPSMRREDFFDYPWPWELRAYLSPSEPWEFRDIDGRPLAREQVRSTLRVFLHRAEAIQWRLLPFPPPARAEPVPPSGPATEDVGDEAGAANPSQPLQAQRQPGGRPTDRDMVLEEAAWRLRNRKTKAKSVAAFARELRTWLEVHGEHRSHGDVMKAETIEDHVRPLWNQHRGKTI